MLTELECTVCPSGCRLRIQHCGEDVMEVNNARCEKGTEYAVREINDPVRTLTTTVRVVDGELPLVSIRSEEPLPRNLIAPAVKMLREFRVSAPVHTGDRLLKNLLDTGVDLLATGQVKKKEDRSSA